MVLSLRIFRRGICRPSKFRRPKYNALLDRLKGTSSDQQQHEVAGCQRCQGVNDSFGTQFKDPSNCKRPTLHIAHSTVFTTGKSDDNDSLTLLESLRQRLASHNIRVDDPAKQNEAEKELSDETEKKGEHQFSKDDTIQVEETVRATPMSDSDNAKDMERPEPLNEAGDRRAVFDPPHIKSYTRYLQQTEQQHEAQMFDELARKYLVTDKDQIDKGLSQDMERLGLPINTREAMRPPVNINVSSEEEPRKECPPKPTESAKTEAPIRNMSYYENASWCNNYFKPTPNETILEIAHANKEIAKEMASKHRRDAEHNDMLPLNWCYDSYFDLQKSELNSNISKLQFDKHDDILPFHLLQCMEFIELDLSVKADPVESPVQDLKVDETLPNHLGLQGNLNDIIPAPVEAAVRSEPIIHVVNSSMAQDSDVTKFEYVNSRSYGDLHSRLYDRNEPLDEQQTESRPMTEATHPIKSSDTILHIQSQTIPKTQAEPISQQAEPLYHTNTAGAKVHEQGPYQATNETAKNILQMNSHPRLYTKGQKADQKIPLANIIHAKVMEQIQGAGTSQKMEPIKRSVEIPLIQSQDVTYLNQKTVQPELLTESKMVADTAGKTKVSSQISQNTRAVFAKDTTQTTKDSSQTSQETQAIVQSFNRSQAERTDASRTATESLQISQERQAIIQSSTQAHEKRTAMSQTKDSPDRKESQAIVENSNEAQAEGIDMHQTRKDWLQNGLKSQAIVQSFNQAQAETTESPQITRERQPLVKSSTQAREERIDTSQAIKDSPHTKESQAILQTSYQVQEVAKTVKAQISEQPDHLAQTIPIKLKVAEKADKIAEEIQPTQRTEAMAESYVKAKTAQEAEATKTAQPDPLSNITKTIDDALKKLNLDSNLSLSELLQRVRTRNRLQYYNDIRTQMINNMSSIQSKRCPPSDRPECPPPPDCAKPCPPPSRKPKKHKPKKCPEPQKPKCPEKPQCPPDPPKCPPEPPKCPKPKKCPKKEKKCPPAPPVCPPKPKNPCPCPCPPPPQCPPQPPKCPCQVTDLNDSVIPLCLFEFFERTSSNFATYLRHLIAFIRQGFLVSRDRLFLTSSADPSLEIDSLKLNRVKDFEPWTPIPSWPFPVHDKKRSLQCPYHGCPYPKPGPVRPNCPELPCAGFPKRLTFSKFM